MQNDNEKAIASLREELKEVERLAGNELEQHANKVSELEGIISRQKNTLVEYRNHVTEADTRIAELEGVSEALRRIAEKAEVALGELKTNLAASKCAIGFYKKELAKLKGDAVPFAFSYNYAGCETCEGFRDWRKELSKERPPEWMLETGKVTDLVELFTHAQPVPVVVLHPLHHFYGNQYYSKYMVDKALKAAGITVKSADGEEK